MEKIYDTEQIKPKECKSFLNYNLAMPEIFNRLGRRDLTSMIPKLNNSKNLTGQRVSWNKIKAKLEDKDVVNEYKLYA